MGLDFSGFESLLLLQHQSQLGYSLSNLVWDSLIISKIGI